MDASNDYVETSDAEELELINNNRIEPFLHVSPDPPSPDHHTPRRTISSHVLDLENSSPRKRIKLDHLPELALCSHIITTQNTQDMLEGNHLVSMALASSSPVDAAPTVLGVELGESQDPIDFLTASPSQPSLLPSLADPDGTPHTPDKSTVNASTSKPPSRSLAQSETKPLSQPWPLFSATSRHSASPIRSSPPQAQAPDALSEEDDHEPLDNPQHVGLVLNEQPSSPLSEPGGTGPSEHAVENELGAREEYVSVHTADDSSAAVAQRLEEEERQARYSFRSRQPRQKNPYKHDQLQYRMQMEQHPDAVVNIRHGDSNRRREHEGDSQETWAMNQDEEDGDYEEETPRPARRSSPSFANSVGEETRDQGRNFDSLVDLSASDDEARHAVRTLLKDKNVKKDEDKSLKQMKKKRLQSFPELDTEPSESLPHFVPRTRRKRPLEVFSPSPPLQVPMSYHDEGASSSAPGSPGPRTDTDPGDIPPTTPAPSSAPDLSFDGYFPRDDGHDKEPDPDFSYLDMDHQFSFASPRDGSSASMSPERAPSVEHGIFQADEHDPVTKESREDRKRRKALERMYPKFMFPKIMNRLGDQQRHQRKYDRDEDGTPGPGHARTRIGTKGRDIEIRGDSESSDDEPPSHQSRNVRNDSPASLRFPSPIPMSDPEAIEVRTRRVTVSDHRRPSLRDSDDVDMNIGRNSDVINISSDSDEDSDDHVSETYYADLMRDGSSPSRRRTMQDQSQIDWMISRTRTMGSSAKSKSNHRTSKQSRRNDKPRLHIITEGAKRYGTERQTLLPFKTVSKGGKDANSDRTFHAVDYETYDLSDDEPTSKGRRNVNVELVKKLKKRTRQEEVYHFQSESTRIASRYRERARRRPEKTLVIDQSAADILQALDPAPKHQHTSRSQRLPPSRTSSKTRQKAVPRPYVDIELEQSVPNSAKRLHKRQVHIRTDLNISFLPSGIRFAETTYLGKGCLYELVLLMSGQGDGPVPPTFAINGLELGPSASADLFLSVLVPFCDRVVDSVAQQQDFPPTSESNDWFQNMRSMTRLFSWLCSVATSQDFETLSNSTLECCRGFVASLSEHQLTSFSPSAFWFAIELTARIMFAENNRPERSSFTTNDLYKFIVMLMQHLQQGTLRDAVSFLTDVHAQVEMASIEAQIAESWICIFHLLDGCHDRFQGGKSAPSGSSHPFWQLVQQLLKDDAGVLDTGFHASERTWDLVYGLCALSQFNVNGMSTSTCRLPPSWSTIALALGQVPLEAIPVDNKSPSEFIVDEKSVDTRDGYIAIVVRRCFLLWSRWHWNLEDALTLLNKLVEIFRSRNFANLRNEKDDFMGFMLYDDVKSLSFHEPTDTACELFLKLVFQAARSSEHSGGLASAKLLPRAKKALQLAVPVSSVHFTKANPPKEHEISMLINRFNAIAISIHVDPTASNLEYRLRQAKSYLDFAAADKDTRMACIRAAMFFTTIARHHRLSIKPLTAWLSEITNVLVDEYTAMEASTNKENKPAIYAHDKELLALLVFAVLGCVRRMMATNSLDGEPRQDYPDPLLLQGPWITRVFATSTNLVISSMARKEVRRFVQAFLDARASALTPPNGVEPAIDAPESQDEWDCFFDTHFDESQLAQLDGLEQTGMRVEQAQKADVRGNEESLSHVIKEVITPAIYRLVCRYFNDDHTAESMEDFCFHADQWIDCWVGCGNVSVQNGKRTWDFFFTLGPPAWEKIINPSWRRRVGLRFNYMLLRLDPKAYEKYSDRFVENMLEALIVDTITIEKEYVALVIDLDKSRHLLFQGLSKEITTPLTIIRADFPVIRVTILRAVLINIAQCLRAGSSQSQLYAGFLATMMTAMRDIYTSSTDTSRKRSPLWLHILGSNDSC
ncbi:hypothetical protein CONPUDRAFT_166954 [Coniophora puteana RWD-64-598 SS2]|uniref:Mus7/MMS22 family-domain-containing protein n=1 Tax=Coniophora puteana (strain RWD-64-598) TaxID=741705 RepID=A0A5M3MJE3_CONPW|nr:uncharacterized protein CONPUDRAFT_166954 [Coniophora puteana RWD-64-598 SS2]EIW79166.1 hypothetical protein CONPUDRAFT_166954 [Coniophora puteana RWD-64-598 SS2]